MEEEKLVKRKKANKIVISIFGVLLLAIICIGIFSDKIVELKYPRYRDFPGVKQARIYSDLFAINDKRISRRNDTVIDVRNRNNSAPDYDAVIEVTSIQGGTRVTVSTSMDDDKMSSKWLDVASAALKADGE